MIKCIYKKIIVNKFIESLALIIYSVDLVVCHVRRDKLSNSIENYQKIVGKEVIDELFEKAAVLKGCKILHVNSTKAGGGVAEILNSMVPLNNALGLETKWEVISGNNMFFECTKHFHNGLQGEKKNLISSDLLKCYEQVNQANSEMLNERINEADFVFIHDPQPAALITHFPQRKNKWIWRCHIDTSNPNSFIWNYLKNYVKNYDATIYSLSDFVQSLPIPFHIIPPSIDPLNEKNMELTSQEIEKVFSTFDIDPNRPMILQISRFDYFKDPLGVIEAYHIAKKSHKDLQLVLAGGGAQDDPEGEMVLQAVKKAAQDDPDIHILFLPNDAHRTINALQRAAKIILQKSVKEGFGLTVTEGLWKKKPVIGGNCGGIKLQVIPNKTGFLVDSVKEAADSISYLLQNSKAVKDFGENGHQHVLNNFLITRHVRDYLKLLISNFE